MKDIFDYSFKVNDMYLAFRLWRTCGCCVAARCCGGSPARAVFCSASGRGLAGPRGRPSSAGGRTAGVEERAAAPCGMLPTYGKWWKDWLGMEHFATIVKFLRTFLSASTIPGWGILRGGRRHRRRLLERRGPVVGHGLRRGRRGHPVPVQLVVELREVVLRHELGRRRRLRRHRRRRVAVHLRLVGRRRRRSRMRLRRGRVLRRAGVGQRPRCRRGVRRGRRGQLRQAATAAAAAGSVALGVLLRLGRTSGVLLLRLGRRFSFGAVARPRERRCYICKCSRRFSLSLLRSEFTTLARLRGPTHLNDGSD